MMKVIEDRIKSLSITKLTNAIDSHIESKNNSPIKITTPNAMNPYLVIEDFGVGMNQQTIEDTYSRYGSSTKRNSNDFNGQLGIGAKVGLAYGTRSFTIRSIKDGQKTLVNVGYDPNDGPYMDIVDVSETNDANGTLIKIQINNSDVQDVVNRARKFARYSQFPVLVNEKIEDQHFIKIDDNASYEIVEHSHSIRDYVVMGNVAYPLKTSVFGYSSKRSTRRAIFYVEMGEVDFAPNREELIWNSFTQSKIDELTSGFEEKFINHHQKMISDSSSPAEARQLILGAAFGHIKTYEYKGHKLDEALDGIDAAEVREWSLDKNNVLRPKKSKVPFKTLLSNFIYSASNKNNFVDTSTIFVVGKKEDDLFQTKHLYKTLKKAGIIDPQHFGYIVHIDEYKKDDFFWIPDAKIVKYSDLEKMKDCHPKVSRPKTIGPKKEFSLGRVDNGKYIQSSVIENKKQILYISREEVTGGNSGFYFDGDPISKYCQFAKLIDSENTEVYFATNGQATKLKKLFPSAKHYVEYYTDLIDQELDNLTDAEYGDFLEDQIEWSSLESVLRKHKDEILDPRIAKIVDKNREESEGSKKVKKIEQMIFKINVGSRYSYRGNEKYKKILFPLKKDLEIESTYPLLNPILGSYHALCDAKTSDHILTYINAVYKQEQESK